MSTNNLPIVDLDFFSIKEQLKNYLKNQTQFKDYNFEGSNMSVLLEIMAYNAYQNNFYTNMAISEMFLDSARLKNSIVSHAKELNYLPRSNTSAKAIVKLTIKDNTNPSVVIIPQYTKFSTVNNGVNYSFITNETYVANRKSLGIYVAEEVEIFEGTILSDFEKEGYIFDVGESNLKCVLSNSNVDISSIKVYTNDDEEEYTLRNDIFGIESDDLVFFVEPYFDDKYSVTFGRNVFGKQPDFDTDIKILYRTSSGDAPNGAARFSTSFRSNVTVETLSTASGGSNRESIENIRYFAPKSIQIQERAITSTDYEILLKQRYPEIDSISVISGDELDPPQYGRVAISVNTLDSRNISTYFKNDILRYLSDKTPLSIDPIFVDAEFFFTKINLVVYYNRKITSKSTAEIEQNVRNTISTYNADNLNDFGSTLKSSRLSTLIDNTDVSIESNTMKLQPYIAYTPQLFVENNPTFLFNSQLNKPYPFRESDGFDYYVPAISSSIFSYNKTCCNLQDDGVGNMQIITNDSKNKQVVKKSIGTVDYETGTVKLVNFAVDSYPTAGIKIYANIKNSDITSPKSRIFTIKDEDISIEIRER